MSRTIKRAYFVEAPYQVEKISAERFAKWQQLGKDIALSLPGLNPYIPDEFTLNKPSHEFIKPEMVVNQPGLRVLYMPSRYFADEPRPM
ncbi:Protease 3 precursor [Serratia fonticola]|uniref:Protease 3 n=1 Tax=Serratia fonticola TaxID=47917 RepID=A0A4U9V128_SERFO|nr:Protease 3 precursor [Serratia fonticola]